MASGAGPRPVLSLALALCLAPAVATDARAAEGGLRPAPFDMLVTPAVLEAGRNATLRVEPRDAGRGAEAQTRVDLYLIRIPGGPAVYHYLGPSGAWSTTPAPYLREVAPTQFTSLVARWQEHGPAGWISLLVVFPRPSAHPRDRMSWQFRPLMMRVRVGAGARESWRDAAGVLGLIALASLTAFLLVMAYPRSPSKTGF